MTVEGSISTKAKIKDEGIVATSAKVEGSTFDHMKVTGHIKEEASVKHGDAEEIIGITTAHNIEDKNSEPLTNCRIGSAA